jgi:hypothetical protein
VTALGAPHDDPDLLALVHGKALLEAGELMTKRTFHGARFLM